MEQPTGPVVVATDGSDHAGMAIEWAADEAARRGLPLRIVHAAPGWREDMPMPSAGEHVLEEAGRQARVLRPGIEVTTGLLRESVPHAIRDEAAEAFETVFGHRGLGGFHGLRLGSTALRVAGRVPGPVVVVRDHAQPPHGEIVAGVDPFDVEPASLEYAFDTAAVRGAALRVIHAFQIPDRLKPIVSIEEAAAAARDALETALTPVRRNFPQVTVLEQVVNGHPVEVLAGASETADLIVVGAHGDTAPGGGLVGSTGDGTIHHAVCPTAIVRPRQ